MEPPSPIFSNWVHIGSDLDEIQLSDEIYPLRKGDVDPGLPIHNPTLSTWLDPPHPSLAKFRSTKDLPSGVVDVVIIGSGLSGTSVAWHLLHENIETKNWRVVMLEARDVCSGATGRNGGHLFPDFYTYYSKVSSKHGDNEAVLHSKFEALNASAILNLIDDEDIECELQHRQHGGWEVSLTTSEFEDSKKELCGMKNAGGYTHGLKIFQGDHAVKRTGVAHCVGAIETPQRCSLKPYALVTSLLQKLIVPPYTLNLQTNTPCESVIWSKNLSKPHIVRTNRGEIKTRHVINATNAWAAHLSPSLRGKVIPSRGQVCEFHAEGIKVAPMGWNEGAEYLIQRPKGSLILGGGRRFSSDNNSGFGCADDSHIDSSISSFLHHFLQRQFPSLSHHLLPIHEWTGIMGFSSDDQPWIGNIPGHMREWVIAGFHGHGMVRIWGCGRALVEKLIWTETSDRAKARKDELEQEEGWPEWLPRAYILTEARLAEEPTGEVGEWMKKEGS